MIDKFDIKNKDFSLALPTIAGKLEVLKGLYQQGIEGLDPNRTIDGMGCTLSDCIEELDIIGEALYPSKTENAASPGAAP